MVPWFDESRLDDDAALAHADPALRTLAESGARVRREAVEAEAALAQAVAIAREQGRPRAVVAAGPDSRLLRAALEPWCPVPFVAWPNPGLPGWAGGARPGRRPRSRRRRRRHGVRGRRGGPARLPGGGRLPAALAGRRARGGALEHDPADHRARPAGHCRLGAGVPRPRRPRPAGRPRAGRRGARRGRDRRARRTATSPSTRPRSWRSRWPTPTRWCGAGRCWPRGPPAGSPSRSAGPAAARRSPATPSTCCR